MTTDHADLIARLRGGSHHAEPMILGGVPHDGRCLRAAEVIRQLLEERDDARATARALHETLTVYAESKVYLTSRIARETLAALASAPPTAKRCRCGFSLEECADRHCEETGR